MSTVTETLLQNSERKLLFVVSAYTLLKTGLRGKECWPRVSVKNDIF